MRTLINFGNLLLIALIMLAAISVYYSPIAVPYVAFLGMGFPLLIAALLVAIVLSMFHSRRLMLVNVLVLLCLAPLIHTMVGFHSPSALPAGIKVMSYNVKNFDLYNWSGNKETRRGMMNLIRQQQPDILCLQEYYTDVVAFDNTTYLSDTLGYPYHYVVTTYDKLYRERPADTFTHMRWGIAIFSRYAIVDTGVVAFGAASSNRCIYAGLAIHGRSLRVYNTHLQSIHLGYDDYDTIDELSVNQNTNWYRIRNILAKVNIAFAKRAAQAIAVRSALAQYQGAKILCGDFNDSPISYAYHTIAEGMQDAFIERGFGLGKTFSTPIGIFRIDYILASAGIKINDYHTIYQELSDHYPVISSIEL